MHDEIYSRPVGLDGKVLSRLECDGIFLLKMLDKAETYVWWRRWWYRRIALDYYAAVRDFGRPVWNCCRANDHATNPNHPG